MHNACHIHNVPIRQWQFNQSIHSCYLLTNMSYILVNVRVGLVDISIKFNYHKLLHVSMPGMHLLPNHKSSCSRLKHPNNKPGIAIVAGTFNEGDLTIVWLLKHYTLLCNGLIIVSSCLCLYGCLSPCFRNRSCVYCDKVLKVIIA